MDGLHVGKAGILLASVAGIGNSVILQDLYLPGDHEHFPAHKLLANGLECTAALLTDQLGFRQLQQDLFHRKILCHLVNGLLFLTGVGVDGKGLLGGFLCLVVLTLFGFVKQAHLVLGQNVGSLLAGLTKPCSLSIGKDLVHVVQLLFQRIDLVLLLLDPALQGSHFRSSVCSFFVCCGHEFSSENRFILPLL